MNTSWIPASELPDTNRPVLLAVERPLGEPFVIRACYIRQYSVEFSIGVIHCDCEYNESDSLFYIKPGWYELLSFWEDWSVIVFDAMPLAWQEIPKYVGAK